MNELVNYIIKHIEGGYYHPDMKPYLPNGDRMADSGETMFGIDRKGGSDLINTAPGQKFWQIIDNNYKNHHADKAFYNDKADGRRIPAGVGAQLRELAANMMFSRYNRYSQQFLSPEARQAIASDPRLQLQFLYACWNGQGNFQLFANVMNRAFENGTRDVGTLYNAINSTRRNMPNASETKKQLFAEGANKLDYICKQYLGGIPAAAGNNKKNIWPWIIGAAALWLFFSNNKKKGKK